MAARVSGVLDPLVINGLLGSYDDHVNLDSQGVGRPQIMRPYLSTYSRGSIWYRS